MSAMAIRLTSERKKRGVTQYELSKKTGIHPTDISKVESGKFPTFPGWKIRIAKALDWPEDRIDELFETVSDN